MKTPLLTLSLCFLFSFASVAQRLTSKYLIGTWNIDDGTPQSPSAFFRFRDSIHVTLSIPYQGSAHLIYTLKMYHDQAVLHLKGLNANNVKMDMYWFIKILNSKTMEAEEPLSNPKSDIWNEDLAITMIKVK
jgi:hypothetical protein